MTLALSTAIRTARAQAIITEAGANAKILFYNGTRPATGAAITAQVLLATIVGGTVLGVASAGALDFTEADFTQTSSGFTAGTPTWVRITKGDDTFCADLSIPGDMVFNGTIAVGVDITPGTWVITEGNA